MLSELQQYLRQVAAHHRSVIHSGPFQIHVDPDTDQPYANYAIPDDDAEPSRADVDALVRAFEAAGRQPAFEFLPECAPAVEPALLAAGFEVTYSIPLMTCSADRLLAFPAPAGIALASVEPDVDEALAREILAVQSEAFGMTDIVVSGEDVQRLRRTAGEGVVACAVEAGVVVGVGMALVIRDGHSEVAGIAVAPRARGRGIASALTSAIASAAIDRGARTLFLTPGDDTAGRAYRRAGFAPVGRMLHLVLPASEGSVVA